MEAAEVSLTAKSRELGAVEHISYIAIPKAVSWVLWSISPTY